MNTKDKTIYSAIIPCASFESFDSAYSHKKFDACVRYSVGDIVQRFEDNSQTPTLYKIMSVMKLARLDYRDKLKSKHRIQVQEVKEREKISYTKNFPFKKHETLQGKVEAIVD
tara:strand:+ start:1102 stop:1440 length:339 start_codon:yes stop_codon:yes gene_type:complete